MNQPAAATAPGHCPACCPVGLAERAAYRDAASLRRPVELVRAGGSERAYWFVMCIFALVLLLLALRRLAAGADTEPPS